MPAIILRAAAEIDQGKQSFRQRFRAPNPDQSLTRSTDHAAIVCNSLHFIT
jgi:hypothetical protein